MYYVYVYRDPRPSKNMQPVYVGKGVGQRDLSHWSKGSHNKPFQDFLSHLKRKGMVPLCERVFSSEVESEAFITEQRLIQLYGRRNIGTGTLFNRTSGGEGHSGAVLTETEKDAIRQVTSKMWEDPAYRDKVTTRQKEVQGTPQARKMKSLNSKHTWALQDVRDKRTKGIQQARGTDEAKQATSVISKAMWQDEQYRAKQSENNKEIANRDEVKKAKSAAVKALWADPVWKANMLAARKKKVDQK